jgi:hypothetical protein
MPSYTPPEWLSSALRLIAESAAVRLYYFGGMIKDQLLGRTSRDYDILVFGDFEKLARILNSLTPGLLSSGKPPHLRSALSTLSTRLTFCCAIATISSVPFLRE